jgi:hypothetical protein
VHDQAGRPIAGAELVNMGNSTDDIRKARTGPDGRFTMDNLFKTDVGEEVVVRASGFAPRRLAVRPGLPGQPAEVAITLEPGHRLRGRVVDELGHPIEGVWVYFAHGNRMFSEGGRGTTGADGRFAFDSLPAACPFSFHKPDYSTIEDRVLALDTGAEATVVMVPAGAIAGRVVDARTGEPVRAFNVQLRHSYTRQPGDPSGTLTSSLGDPGLACEASDGRFKVGNLTVGMPLQVTVSAGGYEHQVAERIVVSRSTGSAVSDFRLAPIDPAQLRTYAGRLLDTGRKPVTGAELRLIAYDPGATGAKDEMAFNWALIESGQLAWFPYVTRFLSATTDDQGRFRFSGVPRSAEVKLAWWGPGIPRGRAEHLERTAEAAAESIELSLPATARVHGAVNRTIYPGARMVTAQRTGDDLDETESTLAAGQSSYDIGGLAPGEYWISVMGPLERLPGTDGLMTARPLASRKVTVRPGERLKVDFEGSPK